MVELMKVSSYIMNIIYTDGILTGLTVKFWNIYLFTNKKMYKIRIPLFPMSYNRKTGLSLRKSIEMLKNRRYME